MERYRRKKLIIIIALVLTISGLSIGFAAFTSVLTISSSATVTPDESTFSVLFSSSNTSQTSTQITPSGAYDATGESATINGTTISGLKANFTKPGQWVYYTFYVHNVGSYMAYLRNITFGSGKTCTPGTGTTASLVEAACDDIYIQVLYSGVDTYTEDSTVVGRSLAINSYERIEVMLRYASDGDVADGDFTVSFDDVSLLYSSSPGENIIMFTVDGALYQAEAGMTWREWVISSYNVINAAGCRYQTSGIYIENSCVELNVQDVINTDVIVANKVYSLG